MKKIYYSLLIIGLGVIALPAKAQTQAGNLMAGAQLLNVTGTFQNGSSIFNLGISPKLGYFINDNVALGGEIDLNLLTATNYTDFSYAVGPFGRYYFNKVKNKNLAFSKRSLFFVEANVNIQGENVKTNGISTNTNGLGIGVGPGLAYFITPNIGFETELKYNLVVGFGNATTVNKVGLNIGFQIYLPTQKARDIINEESR